MESIKMSTNDMATDNVPISKKQKQKIFPLIIALAVLIVGIVIIVVLSGRSVNIDDYIADSIEFRGYNGYGQVVNENLIVDNERLITDLEMQSTAFAEMLGAEIILEDCIDIDFAAGEAPKNLNNGDKVKYVITVDYDKINGSGFKKKLKGKDKIEKTYEVSGLQEIVEINPFDVIEKVIVSESYGFQTVSLKLADKISGYDVISDSYSTLSYSFNTGNNTIYVNFNVPEIENINAGDKIKISLQEELERYADQGIKFNTREQEFSVLTADVLDRTSKITKSSYNILKDEFDKSTENEQGDKYTFCNLYFCRQIGNYTKNISNQIIAIYKLKSGAVGSKEKYVYLYIENPLISSDGEIVENSIKVNSPYSDSGYSSVSELEKKLSLSENGVTVTDFEKIAD